MSNSKTSIAVYFMPGMAASPKIFERICLPSDSFTLHYLEWIMPEKNESLQNYARRMCDCVKHANPILVGVSFGGIVVQEMSRHIPTRQVVIISSVKHHQEFPKKFKFAQLTKAHKLVPTGLATRIEALQLLTFGEKWQKKLSLYEKYLSVRDKNYLDWAIEKIIHWKQSQIPAHLIQIHGTEDHVFPIKNIADAYRVEGGGHAMILSHAKWFNRHLPEMLKK